MLQSVASEFLNSNDVLSVKSQEENINDDEKPVAVRLLT